MQLRSRLHRWFVAAILVIAATTLVSAHDLWIEPTSFTPDTGAIVGLRLRVGQHFVGDPIGRDPVLIHEFIATSGRESTPVVGRDGADPAGLLRPQSRGLIVVSYYSNPTAIALPADTFNRYLSEEGLEAVARGRQQAGATGKEAHERFIRCAKALVQVGAPSPRDADRAIGMPLEIVLLDNPYRLEDRPTVTVQLLYEGHPIAGVLVAALNRAAPDGVARARTDAQGRVRLTLGANGTWLVKAVHMIPAPAGSGAEWQSYWASSTFELAGGRNR